MSPIFSLTFFWKVNIFFFLSSFPPGSFPSPYTTPSSFIIGYEESWGSDGSGALHSLLYSIRTLPIYVAGIFLSLPPPLLNDDTTKNEGRYTKKKWNKRREEENKKIQTERFTICCPFPTAPSLSRSPFRSWNKFPFVVCMCTISLFLGRVCVHIERESSIKEEKRNHDRNHFQKGRDIPTSAISSPHLKLPSI